MKKLILILAAMLLCSSAWAAQKVQVMTDGKIDVDKLPTIDFSLSEDPASPEDGRIWWNETTKQLKVADALGIYEFNATAMTAWDTTPDAFSFTDVVNATTSSTYTSNAITVAGINHPAAISVSGDASAKYSINNATAVSTNGTVASGDEVRAVVTSSASAATAVNATVVIGGVSDAFGVTTAAASGATYSVDEDFEGTGTPSGWAKSAGADFDYTASPIEGDESLFLPSTYEQYAKVAFAEQDGQHSLFFAMKVENWTDAAINYVAVMSGTTEIFAVRVRSTGFGVRGGTLTSPFTSVTMPDAQIVYFWLDFDTTAKTASLYYSATNEKPQTASASITGDQSITTFDSIIFNVPRLAEHTVVYDSVRLQ